MRNVILLHLMVLLMVACNSQSDSPTAIAYENTETITEEKQAAFLNPKLPFTFEGVPYFYFPIAYPSNLSKGRKVFESASYGSAHNYTKTNHNWQNILIRSRADSANFYFLLPHESQYRIQDIQYLPTLDTLHDVSRLLLRIISQDSNQDKVLNNHDLSGLFLAPTDGKKITRLSPAAEQLLDWKVEEAEGLLYFRTQADLNKDGKLNNSDPTYLYQYNLCKESAEAQRIFSGTLE